MANKEKLRASLDRSMARFNAVADTLTDEEWNTTTTGDEGWVARNIIAHLMTAERGMIITAKRSAVGETRPLPDDFSLDRYNASQSNKLADKNVAELRQMLADVRVTTLAFLDEVTDAQMELPSVHPVISPITVGGIFKIIAIHQTQHSEELEKGLARARSDE
jgi:hypothetical protein